MRDTLTFKKISLKVDGHYGQVVKAEDSQPRVVSSRPASTKVLDGYYVDFFTWHNPPGMTHRGDKGVWGDKSRKIFKKLFYKNVINTKN